jgi:aspartate/methionine/tyrosine aminotransferase
MSALRPEIQALRNNGITGIALPRMTDPDVIPLWFGEGDIPTPDYVREATKRALDGAQVFYSHTRGREDLRIAVKQYLDNLCGLELDLNLVTIPGSTMMAITVSAQLACASGSHALVVSPAWPNIVTSFAVTGAEVEHARHVRELTMQTYWLGDASR